MKKNIFCLLIIVCSSCGTVKVKTSADYLRKKRKQQDEAITKTQVKAGHYFISIYFGLATHFSQTN